MGRRTILIIAAVLVAALGTTAVFLYVRGVKHQAVADSAPVKILVAKTTVAAGTTVAAAEQQGAFETQEVPASAVAAGALSSLTNDVQGEIALAPIFPGQQVLGQMFGASGSAATLPIPAGMMAVSVQLGDPERVAGFVQNGSDVAVFVTVSNNNAKTAGANPDITEVLLPRVTVIGIGNTSIVTQTNTDKSGTQNTEQLPKTILTLAVNQLEATKLVHSAQKGALYFALLTPTSKVGTGDLVNASNLLK